MWYRTALAQKHTSVIVALWLPLKSARKLAWKKSDFPMEKEPESAESLHITLVHLGKVSDLAKKKANIREALSYFGKKHGSISGKISGIGSFSEGEGKGVIYASFDSPELTELRHALCKCLEMPGIEISSNHGFTPHISLQYTSPDDSMPPMMNANPLEITFTSVTLAWADDQEEFSLSGD